MSQLYVYLYPFSVEPPSHAPPIPPLEVVRHQLAEPPVLYGSLPLAIHSTREDMHVNAPLPSHPTLARPHCVPRFVLYVCLSDIPTLEIGSAVSFF